MLTETLQSISKQVFDMHEIEVIVVSQTPEIKQHSLLDNTSFSLNVCIRPESDTISALRNYGVTQANGQYLAFRC